MIFLFTPIIIVYETRYLYFAVDMKEQDLIKRLLSGVSLLRENRILWSFHPFSKEAFSWEIDFPEISAFLRSWSAQEVETFELCPQNHPDAPTSLLDIFKRCQEYTKLPVLFNTDFSFSDRHMLHIKERKRKRQLISI